MTLIAIHMLQNHAPSNLNRDDNGDPKDCLFGERRRARISSQALKRSIRWAEQFRGAFANRPELLADRTQLLPELVRKRLSGYDIGGEARQAIVEAAEKFGKSDSGSGDSADEDKPKRGRQGIGRCERGRGPESQDQAAYVSDIARDRPTHRRTGRALPARPSQLCGDEVG
jgi:CRISPR system Cascade subunit CasC